MKKQLAFFLCVALMLSLCACYTIRNPAEEGSQPLLEESCSIGQTEESVSVPPTEPPVTSREEAYALLEEALQGRRPVTEANTNRYQYLMDCRAPYSGTLLMDLKVFQYAYIELDGYPIAVLILEDGDTLLLRCYYGGVILYSFTFRNMTDLRQDGTFSWYHNGAEGLEYGGSRLGFEYCFLKCEPLWRIVNDGEPNAAYYLGGEQVDRETLMGYLETCESPIVKTEPLELSPEGAISPEEAWSIANAYWDHIDGGYDVAAGTTYVYRVVVMNEPNPICPYYRVQLQEGRYHHWQEDESFAMQPNRISVLEEVLVDPFTGVCERYVIPDAK